MISTFPGTLISGMSMKNGASAFVLIAVRQHPEIGSEIRVVRLGGFGEISSFATIAANAAAVEVWKP